MDRKGTRIIILLFVLVVSIGILATAASAGGGTHTVEQGDSIQEAINDADSGDRIEVNGTYYTESVVVNKSVTIVANGDVLLDGENDAGTGFTIVADNVEIDGFAVANYTKSGAEGGHGFLVEGDVSNTNIVNNDVLNVGGSGIAVFNDGGTQDTIAVRDNTVTETGETGLLVDLKKDASTEGVTFERNLVSNSTEDGMGVRASGSSELTNLTVTEAALNETDSAGFSLVVDDATVNSVELSTLDLRNNSVGAEFILGDGASLSDVTIERVLVSGSDFGTLFQAGTSAGHDASLDGVEITESGLNETEGAGVGLFANGTSTVADVTVDNVVLGENLVGLTVRSEGESTIDDVTVSRAFTHQNEQRGISMHAADNGELTNVTFKDTLINGTATHSESIGLELGASGTAHVDDVTVDTVLFDANSNGQRFFAADDGSIGALELDNVVVQDSNGTGISVDGDSGTNIESLAIRESMIRDNDGPALWVGENATADAVSVHHSLLTRNGEGVVNHNEDANVDARFNWWGDSSGPSGDLEDPETGKFAQGTGDSVSEGADSGVANVRFSPAIGGKAETRDQMRDIPEELDREINFEVPGVTIDEPVEYTVEGETIGGPASDFVGLSVWERSFLPLRTDPDDAAMTVGLPEIFLETEDEVVSINRNEMAVYEPGQNIGVEFRTITGADTQRFESKRAQVVILHVEPGESLDDVLDMEAEGDLESQIESELRARTDTEVDTDTGEVIVSSDNASVVEHWEVDLTKNGEVWTNFEPKKSGDYAVLLTTVETGDGFDSTGGDLRFNVFNDTSSLIGVEGVMVREAESTVEPDRTTITPGEQVAFTADSNLGADEVAHAIVAFDREAFEDTLVRINTTDVVDVHGSGALLTIKGTADGEPFLLELNVTDDGEVESFEFDEGGDAFEDADPSFAHVVRGDPASEDLTLTIGENANVTADESVSYKFVHVAADTDDVTHRSSSKGIIEVTGSVDPDPTPTPGPSPGPSPGPTPAPVPTPPVEVEVTPYDRGASVTIRNAKRNTSVQIDLPETVSLGGTTLRRHTPNMVHDTDELTIDTTASEDVPAGTPRLDRGPAFTYFNVDATVNGAPSSDDDFNEVVWEFAVSQQRLDQFDKTAADVKLYRYSAADQEWQELPTEHVGDNEFRAVAPGFSVFAVGATGQPNVSVVDAALASEMAARGEPVDVTATVENDGDAAGEFTVELEVDGEVVDTEDVRVGADESTDVTFALALEELGVYEVSVNGVFAGNLEIAETPEPTQTPEPTETPEPTDPEPDDETSILAILSIVVLGLLLAAAAVIYMYHREHGQFPWKSTP